MDVTKKQIAAARALLEWTQQELSDKSGVSLTSVKRFESGIGETRNDTKTAIVKAFHEAGIDFTDDGGVRPKPSNITIFEGPDCYLHVLDDIYYTLKETKGEALFSCVKDAISDDVTLQKELFLRRAGIKFRSLVEEDDTYLLYPLDEYRYIPKRYFVNNTQIVYDNKIAILINGNEKALVLENEIYAEVQRNLFNLIWSGHKQPKTTTTEPLKW